MYGLFSDDSDFLGFWYCSARLCLRSVSLLLAVFKVAPTTLIFLRTTSMMYLIIGAYLIAVAVKESGLGERIAYKFIVKYVSSFKSIIVSIFALTFILALLIPHPWPRAFLIMSVMAVVVKARTFP